jgi:hypothetical protein
MARVVPLISPARFQLGAKQRFNASAGALPATMRLRLNARARAYFAQLLQRWRLCAPILATPLYGKSTP